MNSNSSTELVKFNNEVGIRYQLYNSLFTSLPFHRVEKTGIMLSLLQSNCEDGFKKKMSPNQILKDFFERHTTYVSEQQQLDLLFRFVQYVERQVVLFDALEDAAFPRLNDMKGLSNPTSEMLSSWFWDRIKPELPELSWITVFETGSCGANFDGKNYRIWKDLTLDSALQLKRAPDGSALRRIHGHTYTLRLHLSAPLDQVMGWTVDFGDVKEIFNPIFKALDHQPLYEIPDLVDCDTASIASWILKKAQAQLPQLDRVDLFETRGCGAIVSAGPEGPALPV